MALFILKGISLKGLNHKFFDFTFPKAEPPGWKDTVQRWYQLDAYAFGLAEGAYRWRNDPKPDLIILASPQASNETDRSFIDSGGGSPAKFAHTLPNIRCSPFCQVMEWSGPVLCLQKDPTTQLHGLIEGFELTGSQYPRIWILSVIRLDIHYKVHCFEITQAPAAMTIEKHVRSAGFGTLTDAKAMSWFSLNEDRLIFSNYEIIKESFR